MVTQVTNRQREDVSQPVLSTLSVRDVAAVDRRAWQAKHLRLLWSQRRLLLRTAALGVAASIVVALLMPTYYTSTAQLMPPDSQSQSGMALMAALAGKSSGALGAMAGDMLGLKSTGALFVGMLRSETCQDRLVQQFDLKHVYRQKLSEDARLTLAERTSILEDRKSGIITISVIDRSPQRASDLANAYVDQLNLLVTELSTSAAHRERVFLEQRLKVAKQELDDASNALGQFSSKNNTMDIQQMGKAMLDAAGNVAGELIAAQAQLEGLRQIYTENNPRVRALSARVTLLRKQLEKLGGQPGNLQKSSDEDESASAQKSDMPYPTIRSLPLLGVKYADYYRRAKIEETVYSLLTEQYEMAKVQEAKETPSVKVLDPARVPEKKSSPNRSLIVFLGTSLALGAVLLWIVVSERWNALEVEDPRREIVAEVAGVLKTKLPWGTPNGNHLVHRENHSLDPAATSPSNGKSNGHADWKQVENLDSQTRD